MARLSYITASRPRFRCRGWRVGKKQKRAADLTEEAESEKQMAASERISSISQHSRDANTPTEKGPHSLPLHPKGGRSWRRDKVSMQLHGDQKVEHQAWASASMWSSQNKRRLAEAVEP